MRTAPYTCHARTREGTCVCVCMRVFERFSGGTKRPEARDIRLLLLQILEIAPHRRPRLRGAARLRNGIFNIVAGDCPD